MTPTSLLALSPNDRVLGAFLDTTQHIPRHHEVSGHDDEPAEEGEAKGPEQVSLR